MNNKQRICLIIGLFLLIAVSLFPPYEGVYNEEGDNWKFYLGHHAVFLPPPDRDIIVEISNSRYLGSGALEDFFVLTPEGRPWEYLASDHNFRDLKILNEIPKSSDFGFIYSHILVTETILELLTVLFFTAAFIMMFNKSPKRDPGSPNC